MKHLILGLTLLSFGTLANSEIRSASGASCESSDFQPWEITTEVGKENYQYHHQNNGLGGTQNEDYVGLQVSYRFGGVEQIDCNTFARKVEREQEAYTKNLELKVKMLEDKLNKQNRVNMNKVTFR